MDSNLSGDKLRSPHVSWVFAQLVTFSIFGRGATAFEPLAGGPLSRLAATAPPRGEPSLASPFGGGGLALARTERASCRPHHPLPWLSPLRARPPRSLVSFWLRAHKVKGKVEAFLKRKRVRPADVPQKTLISLRSAPGAHVRFSLAQARRSAASLACRLGRS